MKSKLLKQHLFSFFLSYNPKQEPSEITFGFYDPKRFVPQSLHWHKVINPVFYALTLTDLRVGPTSLNLCGPNSPMKRHCTICPDSGTSQMTMPAWAINQLTASKHPLLSGPFVCPVNAEFSQPDFVFVLDNIEYHLPSHHWMKRSVDALNPTINTCMSKFRPLTINANNNQNMFILGNTFMQLFYTVFDRQNNRVGFGTAVHKANEIVPEFNSIGRLDSMVEVKK